MLSKNPLSIYANYTPLTKKHQSEDIEAYLSAVLAKELYDNTEQLASSMADNILYVIMKQASEKHR